MTVLVTGGAGFIGTNFILRWVEACAEPVVNLDRLTYAGNPANLASLAGNERYVFTHGDIAERRLVSDLLLRYRPRAVIHLAAESHVDRSICGPADFVQTNVVGTFHLLEEVRAYWGQLSGARREAFRFLHVSTDEVFGALEPGAPGCTETASYAPNSPYAASKAASDHLVRAYHHTYGLPTLTTHCSNNYGPYQGPEKLIPLMILNAMAGKPLPVYGDGLQVRDWLHVHDHCNAIEAVLDRGRAGQDYNVSGNHEACNLDVVRSICAALDDLLPASPHRPHARLIAHVTDRPGHDRRYALDAGKIRSELGWRPIEPFERGLRETVAWYIGHAGWCEDMLRRCDGPSGESQAVGLGQS